jgi:hypothetical protein
MRTATLLTVAAFAAFVGYCFSRGQMARHSKHQAKEDLNRWEGEGGNVPAVATPSPAPTPQSSYPSPDGGMRH